MTGINAMELRVYSHTAARRRGECHAVAATARLEQLIRRGGWRVRLAAQDPRSHSNVRLRRQVSVRVGGSWLDAGRLLLAEGHALWLANPVEWAWNRAYAAATSRPPPAARGCGTRTAAAPARPPLSR